MNEEMAKVTAHWWRRKLECNNHDNGDKSKENQIAGILADLIAVNNKPIKEQLDKFEHELISLIINYDGPSLILNCDYAPCSILTEAANLSEISASVFPWKTTTITEEKSVSFKDGYNAKIYYINGSYYTETIFKEEEIIAWMRKWQKYRASLII